MSRILQVFCILLSAVLLALGIPNELYQLGSPFYGFICLIPLYFVYLSARNYKEAAIAMGLHAFLVHLLSSYWLAFFKDFAALTLGASALWTGLLAFGCGFFYFFPFKKYGGNSSLSIRFLSDRETLCTRRIFWFAICYTIYEWTKSIGFVAYPWGTLYSTTWHIKLLPQIADITGVYGVSFLMALVQALIAEGIYLFYQKSVKEEKLETYSGYIRTAITVGVLFGVALTYGTYQYTKNRKPEKLVNTVMVQQNADPWLSASDDENILNSQNLTTQQIQKAKSMGHQIDLIVWSEGCLKYRFPRSENHYRYYPREKSLLDFIEETNVPFILGGSYAPEGGKKKFNAALLFDGQGNFRGAYPKNHLVPLAEAIPFSEFKPVSDFLSKVIGISAGWSPGDIYTIFKIPCHYPPEKLPEISKIVSLEKNYYESSRPKRPLVQFSTPICFDDAFPDVCRPLVKYGSDFFMNITDDSWSRTKSSEYQHFVIASYRAIEQRTTLARSCNAGYSVVLNPAGKIIMDMPLFEQHAKFVQIPVYKKQITVYQRLGNWLPLTMMAIILLQMFIEYKRLEIPLTVPSERKKFTGKNLKKLLKDKKY